MRCTPLSSPFFQVARRKPCKASYESLQRSRPLPSPQITLHRYTHCGPLRQGCRGALSAPAALWAKRGHVQRRYDSQLQREPTQSQNPEARVEQFFNAAIHALRTRVDRSLTWEDKCKRLLLRFEHLQQRCYGMKLLAYTLINLRAFWGT